MADIPAMVAATTTTNLFESATDPELSASTDAPASAQLPSQTAADNGPVPLSFPAILRNSGLPSRYAHLRTSVTTPAVPQRKKQREDHEGKRWIRRRDNARFIHNPHIVHATKSDYALPPPSARSTFPVPLPPYLSRSASAPSAIPVTPNSASSTAGQFSLSLKGMRRELRRAGSRAGPLVHDVEDELVRWLRGETWLAPDAPDAQVLKLPGEPIAGREGVREVLRTPWQLVWSVEGDTGGFARYVVHCCARYYNAVSFSKDVDGTRLTYILRPDSSRTGGPAAPIASAGALDTPPTTDLSSAAETSESEPELHSDAHSAHVDGALSDIAESQSDASLSRGASPAPGPPSERPLSPAEWSIIGEEDLEALDSGVDGDPDGEGEDLVQSIASLSVISDVDESADRTPRPLRYLRARTWDGRRTTSGSSPSRSPMRRGRRRASGQQKVGGDGGKEKKAKGEMSFYEYLFG